MIPKRDIVFRYTVYASTPASGSYVLLPSFLVYFSPSQRCKQSQSHVFCFNSDPDPKLFPSQTDLNTNRNDATLFWSLVSVHGPKLSELVTVSIQVRAYNIVIEQKLTDSVARSLSEIPFPSKKRERYRNQAEKRFATMSLGNGTWKFTLLK